MKSTQTISWRDVDQFLEDGVVQTATFALHRQSYDAEGNLRVEITECGGSTFDMCSVPFPPFLGAEAYGQFTPDAVWGSETMPRTTITVPLADAKPGAAFKTENFALVNGIQLDDPMGEWPSDRRQVAGRRRRDVEQVEALTLEHLFQAGVDGGNRETCRGRRGSLGVAVADGAQLHAVRFQPGPGIVMELGEIAGPEHPHPQVYGPPISPRPNRIGAILIAGPML